jgi:serralysin
VNVSLRTGTGFGGNAEGDTLFGIENLIGSNNLRAEGDRLTGDSGNNVIDGRGGNDVLAGNEGNDTLIGGAGLDTMTGGADADTFVFHTRQGPFGGFGLDDRDVITDFQVGVDVLEFTGNGINSLAELSFSKVGNDTVISYGYHGDTITLTGVALENLMAHASHDFLFS